MHLTVTPDIFRLAQVFTISRGSRTEAKVLTVRATDGAMSGWGECVPYARYNETLDSVTKASFEYHQPPGSPEQRVSVVSASLAVLLHHRQEGSRSQVSQPWLSAWHFCHSGSLL